MTTSSANAMRWQTDHDRYSRCRHQGCAQPALPRGPPSMGAGGAIRGLSVRCGSRHDVHRGGGAGGRPGRGRGAGQSGAEIPSLVFVARDGGLLIGEAAERRGAAEPGRLAREFKRRMGDPVPLLVGGAPFSAHALTAKLLRHVLDTVTQQQDGPPAASCVTHPANWGPYKKDLLDQAIKLADCAAGRLAQRARGGGARSYARPPDRARRDASPSTTWAAAPSTRPCCAARATGSRCSASPRASSSWAGSTSTRRSSGTCSTRWAHGRRHWTRTTRRRLTALARLRRDCVEAKEALSFDTETMIPVALPGLHTRVRLTRAELEAMIAPVAGRHDRRHAAGAATRPGSSRRELTRDPAGRRVVADPAGRSCCPARSAGRWRWTPTPSTPSRSAPPSATPGCTRPRQPASGSPPAQTLPLAAGPPSLTAAVAPPEGSTAERTAASPTHQGTPSGPVSTATGPAATTTRT